MSVRQGKIFISVCFTFVVVCCMSVSVYTSVSEQSGNNEGCYLIMNTIISLHSSHRLDPASLGFL